MLDEALDYSTRVIDQWLRKCFKALEHVASKLYLNDFHSYSKVGSRII